MRFVKLAVVNWIHRKRLAVISKLSETLLHARLHGTNSKYLDIDARRIMR